MAAAVLLAAAIGAGSAAAQDKAEGEPKQLSAQEKMNRRYPQAVRVGFLVGLPVLDSRDSTLGYIRAVVRTPSGNRARGAVPRLARLGADRLGAQDRRGAD